MHRLQRLFGRLLCREQPRRRGRGPLRQEPGHALDAYRALLGRAAVGAHRRCHRCVRQGLPQGCRRVRSTRPRHPGVRCELPAHDVSELHGRDLRARLSRGRDLSHPDGLNAQVYNRCIGSRYCSNNSPYRLRYFNWFSYYESSWPAPLHMQLNPDLTVRDKGVMEKCTFCVQRIRVAKDKARMEDRKLGDFEFQTACQQTCPTTAIVFGDLMNPETKAAKLWAAHEVEFG